MQDLAALITAIVLVVLSGFFVWVLINSSGDARLDDLAPRAYRVRGSVALVAGIGGLIIAFATLSPWPHLALATEVSRVIDVRGRQWLWEMSDSQARVGETIEFRVTSDDVNHGFGLYDPDERLIAQIQAMPGVVNAVRHRFERPGKYSILCMEYCGVAHHGMLAELQVVAAPAN